MESYRISTIEEEELLPQDISEYDKMKYFSNFPDHPVPKPDLKLKNEVEVRDAVC
jgi:hypothetical protein